MSTTAIKQLHRKRRHQRVRAKVVGTEERPRLSVFRSNRYLYAQIIEDRKGVTLVAQDTRSIDGANMNVRAEALGQAIAEKAKRVGVEKVVFDRSGFLYAGSIKAFADSARKAGLNF